MKGQVPFEFCLKILHFFFFGCVFDHPKKLCFKIWKSSIKICRFCTDFDDDFDVDWQSVFYNLLIINIWATTGTRTPDLLITNELLYQLSYGGNVGMCLSYERRFSASLGRPPFLLLTKTHEVLVSISRSTNQTHEVWFESGGIEHFNSAERDSVCTELPNAGAKVLLFYEICKYFCVFEDFFVILSAKVE